MAAAKGAIRGLTMLWQVNSDRFLAPLALTLALLASGFVLSQFMTSLAYP